MEYSGRYGLRRSHSLKRARLVRPLFDRSRSDVRSVSAGCVRIMYRTVAASNLPGRVDVQAVFVVSRRMGGAVIRNRIRRRMRENYRRHLPRLAHAAGGSGSALTLALVFRGRPGDDRISLSIDLEMAIDNLIGRLAHVPVRNSH